MGLKEVTTQGVETVFKVLKDAVKSGQYVVENDNGWGDASPAPAPIPVRVILDQFRQEDIESTSFSDLIQPTDTKGLVPGADLTSPVKATNFLEVGEDENRRKFSIVAFETDPFEALYTLLLRDV